MVLVHPNNILLGSVYRGIARDALKRRNSGYKLPHLVIGSRRYIDHPFCCAVLE